MRKAKPTDTPCQRVLVIMPRLLSESVMATAALHAIRQTHPDAHITALVKHRFRPVFYGLDSVDRVLSIRKRPKRESPDWSANHRTSLVRLGRRLSRGDFDTAVIFPLSFKAAALPAVAGIKRRIGYESEGRGVLLTDRLVARHRQGQDIRQATVEGYLAFARYLGAHHPSSKMRQVVHPEASTRLARCLKQAGADPARQAFLLLNPGVSSRDRGWAPRRMARLCEMLVERFGLTPVVAGDSGNRSMVQELLGCATIPVIDLPDLARDLHLLKAMMASSRLMVTNDTGPRLMAAAMGVPMLTLFGPTSPHGSGLSVSHEVQPASEGASMTSKAELGFTGLGSLDALHPDEVFEHASRLYEATGSLVVESLV